MLTIRRFVWTAGMVVATLFATAVFGMLTSYSCTTMSGGEINPTDGGLIGAGDTSARVCTQSTMPGLLGLVLWLAVVAGLAVVFWRGFPRPVRVAVTEEKVTV
jgi:hypothetical protein